MKFIKFFVLLFAMGIGGVYYSMANNLQSQRIITGRVTDIHGEALVGVSVVEVGTSNGVVTDISGKYKIVLIAEKLLLKFSYIGFKEKEINVGRDDVINVILEESVSELGEVVVIGYGTQKRISVTGSVSAIQTKEIKQSPAANLAVSLAGRLPGLTSIQRSGEPGRELTQLFIRGASTFNVQAPIILVDGVERDLKYIDPSEVESISILKDASSTAIFGTRGANGVILVTTRRGVLEKPEISFTAEVSASDFTRKAKPVNSYDYAILRNLALANDGLPHEYSAEEIEKFRTGTDPAYPNTDWYKAIFKDASMQHRYNLNISGAGKTMKYFVNAGYLHQGGQFKTEKNLKYDPSFFVDRYNFRSNIDMELNPSLRAFLNVAGYLEQINSPAGGFNAGLDVYTISNDSPSSYLLRWLADYNAAIPGPTTPNGGVVSATDREPPYGDLNRSGFIKRYLTSITASYGMEQKLDFITKGLSTKVILSYDTGAENNVFTRKSYERFIHVIADGKSIFKPYGYQIESPLNIWSFKRYASRTNVQGFLDYAHNFGNHSLSALLLYQQQQTIVEDELPYNLRGFSSRISYGFNNKYLLEFNAGYNGSEQFAKGRRFGFFPAVSAGWVVSEEKFFQQLNKKYIDNLKIRGSYGQVGNDRLGVRRFLFLDDIQIVGGPIPGLGRGQTVHVRSLKNENLQWEVATKGNLGLEMSFLTDFSISVDVFKERRNNILINRGMVPLLIGLQSNRLPPANIGIINNQGYEVELLYKKRFNKDWALLSKFNVNYAHNKVIYADEPQLPESYAYRYRTTGYSIGQLWGYIVDGYFKNQDEVIKSPEQNVGGHISRPGDLKYRDLNGDKVIDSKDLAPIGNSTMPDYSLGAAFNVNFKNLDLSVLLQGVTGVSLFIDNLYFFPQYNFYDIHLNSWTPERVQNGDKISFPRLTTQPDPNRTMNSFTIKDGSYLRLKNIEIGYTVPQKYLDKISAKKIRFYANGFNLLTWDKLPTKNFDPEYSRWASSAGGFSYPALKFVNLGLNITF